MADQSFGQSLLIPSGSTLLPSMPIKHTATEQLKYIFYKLKMNENELGHSKLVEE